jgi:hypothetical protein
MMFQIAWLKGRIGARPNGLMVALLLGLATGLAATVSVAAGSAPVTITWKMADRFGPGYDRNHDGRPDLPNSYEYVDPGCYEVELTANWGASAGNENAANENAACAWTIERPVCCTSGPIVRHVQRRPCSPRRSRPPTPLRR